MRGVVRCKRRTHRLPGAAQIGAVLLFAFPVALLAGCGESAAPVSSASGAGSAVSAASAAGQPGSRPASASRSAVAWVSGAPVAKRSYAHWLAIEQALGAGAAASHRALGFLLSGVWLRREAAARGISISASQAHERLHQLERQSFSQPGSLKRYLQKAHETEADLLERAELEQLEAAVAAQVGGSQRGGARSAALASFQRAFQRRWKSRTTCAPGYVMEDCSEYRGRPENLAAAGGASSTHSAGASGASAGRSAGRSSAGSSAGVSGEVYSTPGGMSISSPAFERNGAIPTQYTCDGADISPPLQWQNVPSGAAALVLFAIDDSSTGPASGIRWAVGDIDPTAKGVEAGKTPTGGIVGADTQGHAGYGGICPPHGKTSTVEFVLYALRRQIPLSPGFTPAIAESEYGASKDLMGSAAVTYAIYHRP
jgi:phosphatidylethanolamine-binding protein (PEBP) family uncharacterized protein